MSCFAIASRRATVSVSRPGIVYARVSAPPNAEASAEAIVSARGDFGGDGKRAVVENEVICDGGSRSQCSTWHECEPVLEVDIETLGSGLEINVSEAVDFDFCSGGVVAEFQVEARYSVPSTACTPAPSSKSDRNVFAAAAAVTALSASGAMGLVVFVTVLALNRRRHRLPFLLKT